MTTFTLTFECDNAVFADYRDDAIADVLLAASKQVRQRGTHLNEAYWLHDSNGNRIGTYKYEDRT
jgi:hypothetical protein